MRIFCFNNWIERFQGRWGFPFPHPISLIGCILGSGALLVMLLTYTHMIGYMTGFIPLAIIIILKVDLNMARNAKLVPDDAF